MSKKNLILRHATTLFARQGFKETSMAEVSRLSGVASATIFYHFSSKEELLIAILAQVKAAVIERFERFNRAQQFENGIQAVEGMVTYYLHLTSDMPDEFLLLHRHFPYQLAEINTECRRHLEAVYNCLVDVFENAICTGQQDGSIAPLPADKTALILFSTVDGIVRFNTYKLYAAGTLYQDLLTCCRRMLQPSGAMAP
jgi:AcrR family transcriptional regulator